MMPSCFLPIQQPMNYKEIQLTNDPSGHCINTSQCFSPDDRWIVYDSRNADTGIISAGEIAMVNTTSGVIQSLYKTKNQTAFGPGVGAVSFSPVADRVLFIHGIRNANEKNPYGMARRTGVAIDIAEPFKPIFMDARDITPPFTPGALRGGTHAHSWSGDGQWISFTYNDYLLEQLEKKGMPVKDLRTVGIMVAGQKVVVQEADSLENNGGECYSFLIARVTENPVPGSDEIEKAFDEGWVGKRGYKKPDGSTQHRAIAFQGNVRDNNRKLKTEIFIADIPDTILATVSGAVAENDPAQRPAIPNAIAVRRISFTKNGVSPVPRHWLRSTPDGALIGFLAADPDNIIQLFGISPDGGDIRPLTKNSFSIQGPFNFSPDGKFVAYTGDNRVWITELANGKTVPVTARFGEDDKPEGAVVWSNDGSMLCYNRRVKSGKEGFLQVFLLKKQ